MPVVPGAGLLTGVPVVANSQLGPLVWAGVDVPIVPITTVR